MRYFVRFTQGAAIYYLHGTFTIIFKYRKIITRSNQRLRYKIPVDQKDRLQSLYPLPFDPGVGITQQPQSSPFR